MLLTLDESGAVTISNPAREASDSPVWVGDFEAEGIKVAGKNNVDQNGIGNAEDMRWLSGKLILLVEDNEFNQQNQLSG